MMEPGPTSSAPRPAAPAFHLPSFFPRPAAAPGATPPAPKRTGGKTAATKTEAAHAAQRLVRRTLRFTDAVASLLKVAPTSPDEQADVGEIVTEMLEDSDTFRHFYRAVNPALLALALIPIALRMYQQYQARHKKTDLKDKWDVTAPHPSEVPPDAPDPAPLATYPHLLDRPGSLLRDDWLREDLFSRESP